MTIQSRKESTRRVKFDGTKVRLIGDDNITLTLEFTCLDLPDSAFKNLKKVLKDGFEFDTLERRTIDALLLKLLLRKLVNSAIID